MGVTCECLAIGNCREREQRFVNGAGRSVYIRKVTGILRSLSFANVKSSRLSLSIPSVCFA